jgi:hypothetical protein
MLSVPGDALILLSRETPNSPAWHPVCGGRKAGKARAGSKQGGGWNMIIARNLQVVRWKKVRPFPVPYYSALPYIAHAKPLNRHSIQQHVKHTSAAARAASPIRAANAMTYDNFILAT